MSINKQVFKINQKYSINLDSFFDLESLKESYDELVSGLIKSKKYFTHVEIGKQQAIFDKDHIAPTLYMKEVFASTNECKKLVEEGFSYDQIYDYVRYRFPVKSLGTKLLLRTYPGYDQNFNYKHIQKMNKNQPAYKNFPTLKKWINDSGAFKEVGRILLFVNEVGSTTPTHCDYSNLQSFKDQFIWINLFQKKKFFVLDENFKKQYVKGEINIFDNANWHGSDPADYSCFTIRVDGLFSDEFLEKTGLYDHFKSN